MIYPKFSSLGTKRNRTQLAVIPHLIPSDGRVLSAELMTLEKKTPALVIALKRPEGEVVHFLQQEGFFSEKVYKNIVASQGDEEDKAGELVSLIKDRVKLDSTSYHTFVRQLELYGNRFQPILKILGEEYARLRGSNQLSR